MAPREVVLGHEGPVYAEVLEGLEAGERIVTSAQFLIDSEARLQEAVRKERAQRQARREIPPDAPAAPGVSETPQEDHSQHGSSAQPGSDGPAGASDHGEGGHAQ